MHATTTSRSETPSDGHAAVQADAIRHIAQQLSAVDEETAKFIQALAFILARVACADDTITDPETLRMEEILADSGGLSPAQAVLGVELAKHRRRFADSGHAYGLSRDLRRKLTVDQRIRVMKCLFAVAAADGAITHCEQSEIAQIAGELGFTRRDVGTLEPYVDGDLT